MADPHPDDLDNQQPMHPIDDLRVIVGDDDAPIEDVMERLRRSISD